MTPSRSDAARPGDARDGPDLHEIAQRVARLRPDWQQPQRFFEERSDLAHALRRLARLGGLETRTRVPPSPARERLALLIRAQAHEIVRLRRLLAAAARPPPRRRRRSSDDRQRPLPLPLTGGSA
jgi:hypothetical protein